MRIAVNAALVGKHRTGIGTHVKGLIRSLAQLGHEVLVLGSSPDLPRGPGITTQRTPAWLAYDASPYSGTFRLLWNLFVLPAILRGRNIDVVISQNAEGTLWPPVPQVLTIHDLIPLLYSDEASRLRSYYKKILPSVLRRTAAVIAVSQHTRTDLIREYKLNPANVHVAHNGIDFTPDQVPAKPAALPDHPYFLFVGTFAPRKNLATVIRALAQARAEVPEFLVVVAYPDRWTRECLRLAEDVGIAERIVHLSGILDHELAYAYRNATALFLLSEYEGFGYPALEAMLAGTPAVVSDSRALAEVVGDAAVTIGAHDVDAAADAMRRLSGDRTYREELGRAARQRAEIFTWDRAGTTISDVLSQLIRAPESKLDPARKPNSP